MQIHEVEYIVGLSKKSIRYYEQYGLLTPKRSEENDYRIYSEEDIKKLKIIKFLRELDVPIRTIKKLNDNEITLQMCMEEQMKKISAMEENYTKVKNMCKEIAKSNDDFKTIDITKYFQEMNKLNKEGFTMRRINSNRVKKIRGAFLSSFVFIFFFFFLIILISYFQITEAEKMPWILYIVLMTILFLPVVCIVINLISRIKEIRGGEEDEASKY